MVRASILGLGSYVPDRVVTNDQIRFLNEKHEVCAEPQTDTNHEWIKARTGIEERRYVPADSGYGSSDLGLFAAKLAIEDAGLTPKDIDCIIFGTLSPDIHFPGNAVFLQSKLGIDGEEGCACYDIRQQCSGFVYGLQMADAFVRTGLYKHVLLVGAELHSHSLDFTTRGRDVMVLFGDGAGAAVIGALETDDEKEGILYTHCQADGAGAMDLYLKVFEIAKAPYVYYDANDREQNQIKYPQMNGKKVFLNAVRNMVVSVQRALKESKLTWDEIDWFVPHQANLRINEAVVQYAEIPPEKALNTIQVYGNTTAATVPLTIDHYRKLGKVKKGDRILSTVFGAGFTWGSAIFRV
ncbi:MAG: ketoacyl-ACP synthase III [Polyangiaceae bacterium]|jgi:3-oxoacyl-[acyl-carrier-protein] synthase-3|nr:ketoacyl-ACP synthase III [Polyangiaceae bacterium]